MRENLKNRRATLYMARNIVNDDFYIGVTCGTVTARMKKHLGQSKRKEKSSFLHHAIRKYGADNFIWTKIGSFSSYQEGLYMEVALIAGMKPKYNISKGGESSFGCIRSEETRLKLRLANFGKRASQETKDKISKIHKGKKLTDQHKKKLSIAQTGKKRSQETKDKLSKRFDGEYFKNYRILGTISMSKKVLCLDDGRVFDSIAAAGRFYNISYVNISGVCRNLPHRKTAGGKTFKFLESK